MVDQAINNFTNTIITPSEIKNIFKVLKNKKIPGEDRRGNQILKFLPMLQLTNTGWMAL